MTEPSQYFKGRTVQEQMDEVIGYVDKRAEEVAAAKADDVLQPAEAAKTAAQAAAQEAEAAKNATIAALPTIQQDISDLKAENVALDGRLNTVELKVQTAEGNIVTIQGQIVALQTADGQNVKINQINKYAVGLTGNQTKSGNLTFTDQIISSRGQNQPHAVAVNTAIPSVTSKDAVWAYPIIFKAADLSELGHLTFGRTAAGKSYLTLSLTDSNNVNKTITLGVND